MRARKQWMADLPPDPPIIDYPSALPVSKDHRPAGIIMLIWSSVLIVAALAFATLAIVMIVGEGELLSHIAAALMMGFMAFALAKAGLSLIHVARHLLNHEVVVSDRMIDLIRNIELAAYLVGSVTLVLSLATAVLFVAAFAIPLLVAAGAMTYTRIVLRRVKRFQESREPP
jgi:hypothetical protein